MMAITDELAYVFVFVSARKSTIAPTQLYQQSAHYEAHPNILHPTTTTATTLSTTAPTTTKSTTTVANTSNQLKPSMYLQKSREPIGKQSKPSPYNIDYIVKDAGKAVKKDQHSVDNDREKRKHYSILKRYNEGGARMYGGDVDKSHRESRKDDGLEGAKKMQEMDVMKVNTVNGAMQLIGDEQVQSERFMNTFADKSGEVKHARTPLNICSNVTLQTHSPQLPIPSPTYPVQAQSQHMETAASTCQKKQIHILPNTNSTFVPIVNNNYINNAPQTTSQNDLNKTDYQLVHSISVRNHVNSVNNTEPITNLTSECKLNDLSAKKIVTSACLNVEPPNITTTNGNGSNKCELNVKKIKTEKIYEINSSNIDNSMVIGESRFDNCNNNAFTVLNIPNLQFTQQPPTKRQKMSKIDLAILRRKVRRQKRLNKPRESRALIANAIKTTNKTSTDFGVAVLGFSDSSSSSSSYASSSEESESDEEMDLNLWIKSGPPCKPDYDRNKLDFLGIFKLTTPSKRNGTIYCFSVGFYSLKNCFLI